MPVSREPVVNDTLEFDEIEFALERLDRRRADDELEELVDVYADVYGVTPYKGDPFFSPQSHAARVTDALPQQGFEILVARSAQEIAGYVYGITLPADRSWWTSLGDARPPGLQRAAEEGHVFWLRELLVRRPYRQRGLARTLHNTLVAARDETATVLTCIIGNEPAF